jgi:hypothetical protein
LCSKSKNAKIPELQPVKKKKIVSATIGYNATGIKTSMILYGAYSRGTKRRYAGYLQRSIRQATFEDFITKANKWAPNYPSSYYTRGMAFALYEKGSSIENEVF